MLLKEIQFYVKVEKLCKVDDLFRLHSLYKDPVKNYILMFNNQAQYIQRKKIQIVLLKNCQLCMLFQFSHNFLVFQYQSLII